MPLVKKETFKDKDDNGIIDLLYDQLGKIIGFKKIHIDLLESNYGKVLLDYSILNCDYRDQEDEIMDDIEMVIKDLGGDYISRDRYAIGKYFIIFSVF